jgi:hypothetical protein
VTALLAFPLALAFATILGRIAIGSTVAIPIALVVVPIRLLFLHRRHLSLHG